MVPLQARRDLERRIAPGLAPRAHIGRPWGAVIRRRHGGPLSPALALTGAD
jgi:hypothetical protein